MTRGEKLSNQRRSDDLRLFYHLYDVLDSKFFARDPGWRCGDESIFQPFVQYPSGDTGRPGVMHSDHY